MDIRISGHQMETGAALQDHVAERLDAGVGKYFDRAISAHVTFGKAPAGMVSCDIVAHVIQGFIVKGHAEAGDAHAAFDQAQAKVEKQVRRYKRRLTDRHEQADRAMLAENAAYTVFAPAEPVSEDEPEEEAGDAPVIIAETRVDVPEASVSDAVMMLDLRDTSALLFKNAGTGRHNMVYRRPDGSIGWVEPS